VTLVVTTEHDPGDEDRRPAFQGDLGELGCLLEAMTSQKVAGWMSPAAGALFDRVWDECRAFDGCCGGAR
jgi:hypothetical protein